MVKKQMKGTERDVHLLPLARTGVLNSELEETFTR
jgi:hypothetical protein